MQRNYDKIIFNIPERLVIMKRLDDKYEEIVEITPVMDDEQKERAVKRGSIAVILILLALVTVVTFITYFVEVNFGKNAGTVALIIVAAVIAIYLYRKEIMAKFKRK